MFDPCHPAFHLSAAAIKRPFHHVAHRVVDRALRRTGSHAAAPHVAQPLSGMCSRVPGVLSPGPGLAAPAFGTLGGIAGLSAVALLSAGLALPGLGLGPGSSNSGVGETASRSSAAATATASSGSGAGQTQELTSSTAPERFTSLIALGPSVSAIWFAGPETVTAASPSLVWMPLAPSMILPDTEAPLPGALPVVVPHMPDNIPEIDREHSTAVPEPTSSALLAVGGAAVLFVKAIMRRRRGRSPSDFAPSRICPIG